MCKRIGRKLGSDNTRRILVEVQNFDYKLNVLSSQSPNNQMHFKDYDINPDTFEYGKVHTNFCKYVLNVHKSCNHDTLRAELGRCPITFKVWELAIKYWTRLTNGSVHSSLLNEAYLESQHNNSLWIESIKRLMYINGFSGYYNNPKTVFNNFHKIFKDRIQDQYMQNLIGNKQSESLKLVLLGKEKYSMANYIQEQLDPKIKNYISNIRCNTSCLRTALNKKFKNLNLKCPFCKDKDKDVEHFLFQCAHYTRYRIFFRV